MTTHVRIIFSEPQQAYYFQTSSTGEQWRKAAVNIKSLVEAENRLKKSYFNCTFDGTYRHTFQGEYIAVDNDTLDKWREQDKKDFTGPEAGAKFDPPVRQAVTRLTISAFDRDGLHECGTFPITDDTGDPLDVLDKIKKKILHVVDEHGEADLNFGVGTVITILVQ